MRQTPNLRSRFISSQPPGEIAKDGHICGKQRCESCNNVITDQVFTPSVPVIAFDQLFSIVTILISRICYAVLYVRMVTLLARQD